MLTQAMATGSITEMAGPSSDEINRLPAVTVSGERSESSLSSFSLSDLTLAFPFSSGNPRIEETRGVMYLYREDPSSSSSSDLPVIRKTLVCVLGVPNHMTYADFCQYCGSFIDHVLDMRTFRNDGMKDHYSVLIRFDDQDSTDGFYKHYNDLRFSSMEAEVCCVRFALDVLYTGLIEHAKASNASSTEPPTCAVCLERLDQGPSGILTTICNHSFHCNCIRKWEDSSCPVCRYCHSQAEKSTCSVCETTENLSICVICGFVGCGKYKAGHAEDHWKETHHCYFQEVETRRVWDYVKDNYVHRLIMSKTDGKLVELNSHCEHTGNGCGSCSCEDHAMSEAVLNSKVEAIVNEYNELLATQLENQKVYFESSLQEVKEEIGREISKAVEKIIPVRLQKLQSKLDRCYKEKKILEDLNENLLKNHEIWEAKLLEIEKREKKVKKLKDDIIKAREEQVRVLMMMLDGGGETTEQPSSSGEIKDGERTEQPSQSDQIKEGETAEQPSGSDEIKEGETTEQPSRSDEIKDGTAVPTKAESSSSACELHKKHDQGRS